MNSMQDLFEAVPERVARVLSGTPFVLSAELQAARIGYLSQYLNWLTPFSELAPEAQRALGLLALRDKPLDLDESMESEEA
jgi:hypothetical protein